MSGFVFIHLGIPVLELTLTLVIKALIGTCIAPIQTVLPKHFGWSLREHQSLWTLHTLPHQRKECTEGLLGPTCHT